MGGPLFYQSCSNPSSGTRLCRKRLDEDAICPSCGPCAAPVPHMHLRRASFLAADGTKLRLSALGYVAEELVGQSAEWARDAEATAVLAADSKRAAQHGAIRAAFGKDRELAVAVDRIVLEDNTSWVSATVCHLGSSWSQLVASSRSAALLWLGSLGILLSC